MSTLISAGFDVVTISTRLGHVAPGITLKVRSHLYETSVAVAVNAALGVNSAPKTT